MHLRVRFQSATLHSIAILIFSTRFLLGVIVLKQPSLFVATISIFVNLPITMRALI